MHNESTPQISALACCAWHGMKQPQVLYVLRQHLQQYHIGAAFAAPSSKSSIIESTASKQHVSGARCVLQRIDS